MVETEEQKKVREEAEAAAKAAQEAAASQPAQPVSKARRKQDDVRYRILHTRVDDHVQNDVVTAEQLGGDSLIPRLIELQAIEEVR